MAVIKSVLKAGIDALSDDTAIKGKSLPNALKKIGVTDEELKFSGVLDNIDSDAKYSKENLAQIVAGRKDEFGVTPGEGEYNWVSLPEGVDNPTYKENIYTFKQTDQEVESRYTSNHFSEVPNYLMHTRTFDTEMNGKRTRVLQEIQSDLHQMGRTKGYNDAAAVEPPNLADVQDLLDEYTEANEFWDDAPVEGFTEDMAIATQERVVDDLRSMGLDFGDDVFLTNREAAEFIAEHSAGGIPKSPYEKSWLAKGIEREIDAMLSSGKEQLAIPIKGGQIKEQLQRGDGPQKFYETQVLSTAKKLAKQNDMDFEIVSGIGKIDYDNVPDKVFRNALEATEMPPEVADLIQIDYFDVADVLSKVDTTAEAIEDMAYLNYRSVLDSSGERLTDKQNYYVEQYFKKVVDTVEANAQTTGGEKYAVIRPKYGEAKRVDVRDLDGLTPEQQKEAIKGIGLPEVKSKTNMKLYSSPAAAVGATYLYLKDGNDPSTLQSQLAEMGYEQEDIDTIIADAQAVQQAVADGYTEDEALAYIQDQEKEIDEVVEAPPSEESVLEYIDRKAKEFNRPGTTAYEAITNPNANLSPEDLLSKLKVIQPNMTSVITRAASYNGDKLSFNQVELANKATAQRIVDMFKERGVDVEWHQKSAQELGIIDHFGGIGEYYTRDAEGNLKRIDEGFWASLASERSELGWSIGGGIAGAKAGAQAASKVAKNPFIVGAASLAGSILGAAGGSIIGTELDYLRESVELSEEVSGKIALHKATTAAETSVIGDVVGFGIFQSAGTIWKGVKRAKDLIIDGNIEGAMSSLKTSMFVDDSEARSIVLSLEQITGQKLPKGRKGEIAATLLTKPGSESIVTAASAIDPQAAAAVSKAIDNRARDVLAATASLTEENAGKILIDDLTNYTTSVKQFYGSVKDEVTLSPRLNKFQWDYDKLAINPVLDSLMNNITDPSVQQRFLLQAERIKGMSDSRNLADLIELRQFVNDFKFNKRISKAKDFAALNSVLGRIDKAIDMGAGIVVNDPTVWKQQFQKAKAKYAQMKSIEKNVIAKAASRPGVTNDTIVRSLTKYITSLDGSFQDVMSALPMTSRPNMEGAVIDALANKFADGLEDGMRVIHYPALAKELDKISFTTPEARKAKAAIQNMANVFKNDLNLSNSTGNFQLPKMQSYLTADPVMRAKYEFASSMFNYAKRLAPTQKSDNLALVMQASKVLEQPLNAKSMKELMEAVSGDVNLTKQATIVQQNAAREASKGKVSGKVKFYGKGDVLSVKGNGEPTSIARHLIATYDIQKRVADTYGIDYNDKKSMAMYLKKEGFEAMQQGSDSVRRIK